MKSKVQMQEVINDINDFNKNNYPQINEYWDEMYGQKVLIKVFKPMSSADIRLVVPKYSLLSKLKRELLGE